MNPELHRNLWLEFTPRRLVLMALVLGVTLGVTALAAAPQERLQNMAALGFGLYGLIVMLWGARNAANALAGEVRDRTWDMQRLSAIDPWSMTWGKLLGSTAYTWFGGLLALTPFVIVSLNEPDRHGPVFLGLCLALGAGAQALALLLCLAAARRRPQAGRFDVLIYALIAFGAASSILQPAQALREWPADGAALQAIVWMGSEYPFIAFYAASALLWTGVAVFGCWRLMRRELMMPHDITGPLIVLAVIALYGMGFVRQEQDQPLVHYLANACGAGAIATGLFTAACTLAEPKDPVALRWISAAWRRGVRSAALARAPGFTIGFMITLILGLLAAGLSVQGPTPLTIGENATPVWPLILSALGFLARDIIIFVFFHAAPRQRRGDFASLVLLALLYGAGAVLTSLAPLEGLRGMFVPTPEAAAGSITPGGPPIMFLAPWLQAAAFVYLARARLAAPGARPGAA